jgi:hypothetical protein
VNDKYYLTIYRLGDGTTTSSSTPKPYFYAKYPNRTAVGAGMGYSNTFVLYNASNTCNGLLYDDVEVCNKHGSCVNSQCVCENGYSGVNCEIFTCLYYESTEPDACSRHGTCTKLDFCICYPGYSGTNCEIKPYGFVYGAGLNNYYQTGRALDTTSQVYPYRPLDWYTFQRINMVSAGNTHSLTLTHSGVVHCFGDNT